MVALGWTIGLGLGGLMIANHFRKHIRDKRKRACRRAQHDAYLAHVRELIANKEPNSSRPPNIIIVLMDDMGYADISAYGATALSTPNIDRLAHEGVSLHNFYASSPVCSPSRAGLLTGRYPMRMHISAVFFPRHSLVDLALRIGGIYSFGVDGLLEDEITLGEALQAAGFRTALLGKWHLGDHSPHRPNEKGFDFFYGSYYSNDMKPYAFYRNGAIDIPAPVDQTQITKKLAQEAIHFIEENANRPFFLHYCQPFPHDPVHCSSGFAKSSKAGTYGDCVQEVDWSVGEIIKTLERLKLRENTIIIFTSDNGPWYEGNPGYVRGRKGLVFEGGQRVPCIWSWPGHIPNSIKSNEILSNLDFFPTLLQQCGVPLPTDRVIDGRNIMPHLIDHQSVVENKPFFYCWNKKVLAVRDRTWKYHRKHMNDNSSYWPVAIGPLLFNLRDDPTESYNQLASNPAVGEQLQKAIDIFQHELQTNPRGWLDNTP
jgi:arylsulfatase A-like enzyme